MARLITLDKMLDRLAALQDETGRRMPALDSLPKPYGERLWVYVFASLRGGVKIGVARDVDRRFLTVRTGHPYPLTNVGAFRGSRAHELYLHKFFARERLAGEWFRASPRIKTFVVALSGVDEQ